MSVMRKFLAALLLTTPLMGCGFGCSLNSAVFDEQSNVLAATHTINKSSSTNYALLEATHAGNTTLGNQD